MNRKTFLGSLACATVCLPMLLGTAHAEQAGGTPDEAKAMVKRAVAYVKEKGPDAAYTEFSSGTSFKDRDLYVSFYDFKGNCLAHGANPKLIGKNLWDLKDASGVEVIKMQTEIAQGKGEGWSETFSFVNPTTKKIQQKVTYVQRVGESWIGVGYYK